MSHVFRYYFHLSGRDYCGHDCMVAGLTTLNRAYHHTRCELHTSERWFSPGTPASSINKTDRHDVTEMLYKVYPCVFRYSNMSICLNRF